MHNIQEAVRSHLQAESGIRTVCAPDRCAGAYPVLAVSICQEDAVLLAGGKQALCGFALTVTAAALRERQGQTELLTALVPVLLRGIPMTVPPEAAGGRGVRRMLSPRQIRTEGDKLTFRLELCLPVPPKQEAGADAPGRMETLHLT